MQFRDLKIGDRFMFDHPEEIARGVAAAGGVRGPFVKFSPRKFQRADGSMPPVRMVTVYKPVIRLDDGDQLPIPGITPPPRAIVLDDAATIATARERWAAAPAGRRELGSRFFLAEEIGMDLTRDVDDPEGSRLFDVILNALLPN